jgi:hypothetical protein
VVEGGVLMRYAVRSSGIARPERAA